MFGYVQLSNPHDAEFGYVTLKQLESIEIKAKLNGIPFTIGSIERDIHLPEHCNLKQAMELSDIEVPQFLIDMQEETDEVYEDEEIEIKKEPCWLFFDKERSYLYDKHST